VAIRVLNLIDKIHKMAKTGFAEKVKLLKANFEEIEDELMA